MSVWKSIEPILATHSKGATAGWPTRTVLALTAMSKEIGKTTI
jgi:hypothetical protein